MDAPDDIKRGILRTRELVAMYYGRRMVVDLRETFFSNLSGGITQLLKQDPSRIRYELTIMNAQVVVGDLAIGTGKAIQAGQGTEIIVTPHSTYPIVRDWLGDLEGVCLEVVADVFGGNMNISVRETFLTPAPVDEVV
jgi:hypothetical protein